MFTVITENKDQRVETMEEAINLGWQEALSGCKLLMIESPQGFLLNLDELDQAYEKQQEAFKEISA